MGEPTLESMIGRMLIGGFQGEHAPEAFMDLVRTGRVGGVILFRRNFSSPAGAKALLDELDLAAPLPLWTAIDQEGGRVQRLMPPFPQLPSMRALAQSQDVAGARTAASYLAPALLELGFRQNYAPVLDVDTNPDNPVIGDRSFSADPGVVAAFGTAFIDGLEAGGIAACAKHFPGHGDTNTDSHLALPRLDHDMDRLERVELAPFRAAIAHSVASIMTAHILFSALDPEHPATLSTQVLVPILRERMGYGGVVVSDDLEMKAIADHYGIEDAAVRAVQAGCDQLLVCSRPDLAARAHDAIRKAVDRGHIARARIEEAYARVCAMAARFSFAHNGPSFKRG